MKDRQLVRARTGALLALAAWLTAAIVAGRAGLFTSGGGPPVALLGFVVVPLAAFVGAWFSSPAFRRFASGLSLAWIVGAHAWRLVGLAFVIGWLRGALPAGFAIPEGLGDAAAAIGAIALVPLIRHGTASRGWLLAWNVFGLVDLASALVVGVLYSDSPLGLLAGTGPTTTPMITFPVSLIPTFLVPLFILLHLLTFTRIPARQTALVASAV